MRELTYVTIDGDIVFTLKDKRTIETTTNTRLKTKLFDIPEKKNLPKIRPWITVNGKLVRQYA